MTRKKSKSNQSSNTPVGGNVNADSSDSNEHNEKNVLTVNCNHIAKSVDVTQVVKVLKNGEDLKKNFCPICVKESKGLKGSDLFVCLKCGTKACCKEHSKAHYAVPRSDLHSLAYDFTSKTLWCYGCSCEINEREAKNKKLTTCIISVNRQLSTFAAKDKTGGANVVENKNDNNERENDPSSQNGTRGKKFQLKNKPVAYQSPLSSVPVRGLSNLGNTCYFNSVMQCLARTRPLLMELKDMDHKIDVRIELKGGDTLEGCLEKWDPMSECLYETLTALITPGSVFVPSKFLGCVRKKHPQFEGYDQHDAHELLRHTLDSIKMNDLKRYRRLMLAKKGLSEKVDPKQVPQEMHKQIKELEHRVTQVQNFIPEKTFKGKLVSRVECQECNHSSEYIEGFLDLSLPVLADKPHPPVAKRKNGCASEPQYEESSNVRSTNGRRHENVIWQKRRNMKRSEEIKRERKDQGDMNEVVDEVAVEAEELAERPNVSLGLDEDKPHESGYSSEKASSSLRGSPSSEEVRSSSPCDDSWSTVPQFTDSWLSSLPGGIMLPVQGSGDVTPNLVNRPPTHIPLHADGTPDLTHLTLHDSNGSTLKSLCQDTRTIMEQEPYWRDRIHQTYFNTLLETENDEYLARLGEHDSQDLLYGSRNNGTPTPDDAPAVTSRRDETEYCKDVSSSLPDNVGEDDHKLDTINDSESALHSSTVIASRSMSPPFRRNVQINSQNKRDSSFSPVREEEGDSMHTLNLDTIQETNQEKSDFNFLHREVRSPTEAEEYFRVKLEESRRLNELLGDAKQAKLSDVDGLFDQSSLPKRFGCSNLNDGNSECDDDWSSFHRSQKNGNCDDLRNHIQTAPNNSLDSEGNESGNEKSMNTCSEEFPDELLPEDSPKKNTIDAETSQVNEDGSGEHLSKEADESLPDNLLDLSEDGDFEPLLDSLPTNSKLSIACSDDVKNEPELHELCDKLRITDDGSNSSKLDVPEDTHKSEFTSDVKNEIASLMQKRESNKDLSECSVESCLRQFTSIEVMTGSNKVGCSACTERQNKGAKDGKTVLTMATKQLLIGQAPPILILHLKRFQVQLHSFRKLSKHVSFPLVLDLAPFCTSIGEDKNKVTNAEPMPYFLYGIVEHRGTLNSGHYVAYVKTEEDNKRRWFCISDSHVNEVSEERVLKTEAYLLFYSRITFPYSP